MTAFLTVVGIVLLIAIIWVSTFVLIVKSEVSRSHPCGDPQADCRPNQQPMEGARRG